MIRQPPYLTPRRVHRVAHPAAHPAKDPEVRGVEVWENVGDEDVVEEARESVGRVVRGIDARLLVVGHGRR